MPRPYRRDLDMPTARKSTRVPLIPEEIQAPMRQRLTLLRQMSGRNKGDFASVSSGSLTVYELHDISTMKLGFVYSMAVEIGMSMPEIMAYLAGNLDDALPIPEDFRLIRRMAVYMRGLPTRAQQMACDQVLAIVEYLAETGGGPRKSRLHHADPVRRSSKAALEAAAEVSPRDGH